jgi:hypothetical protein
MNEYKAILLEKSEIAPGVPFSRGGRSFAIWPQESYEYCQRLHIIQPTPPYSIGQLVAVNTGKEWVVTRVRVQLLRTNGSLIYKVEGNSRMRAYPENEMCAWCSEGV